MMCDCIMDLVTWLLAALQGLQPLKGKRGAGSCVSLCNAVMKALRAGLLPPQCQDHPWPELWSLVALLCVPDRKSVPRWTHVAVSRSAASWHGNQSGTPTHSTAALFRRSLHVWTVEGSPGIPSCRGSDVLQLVSCRDGRNAKRPAPVAKGRSSTLFAIHPSQVVEMALADACHDRTLRDVVMAMAAVLGC